MTITLDNKNTNGPVTLVCSHSTNDNIAKCKHKDKCLLSNTDRSCQGEGNMLYVKTEDCWQCLMTCSCKSMETTETLCETLCEAV